MGSAASTAMMANSTKTALDILEYGQKARDILDDRVQKELGNEKVLFHQEIEFPMPTRIECVFWAILIAGFCSVLFPPISLLPLFQFIDNPSPLQIFGTFLTVFVVSFIIGFWLGYSTTKSYSKTEKKRMIIQITDHHFFIVKTDVTGLLMESFFDRQDEKDRAIFHFKVENILRLKKHVGGFIFRRFRHREDLVLLSMRRRGEIIQGTVDDGYLMPVSAMPSFLSTLRKLNPGIKIQPNVDRIVQT